MSVDAAVDFYDVPPDLEFVQELAQLLTGADGEWRALSDMPKAVVTEARVLVARWIAWSAATGRCQHPLPGERPKAPPPFREIRPDTTSKRSQAVRFRTRQLCEALEEATDVLEGGELHALLAVVQAVWRRGSIEIFRAGGPNATSQPAGRELASSAFPENARTRTTSLIDEGERGPRAEKLFPESFWAGSGDDDEGDDDMCDDDGNEGTTR